MSNLPQLAVTMQSLLRDDARQVERESGFVQRRSKLAHGVFAQTVVFSWLEDANATYERMAQVAASLGTVVSPQAIEQRFTARAADFLRRLLEKALTHVVESDPVAIPLLQRFHGVFIQDSTTITLPDELGTLWPGCGGRTQNGTQAALKLQTRINLLNGSITDLELQAGRGQDRNCQMQHAPLPSGALRLADLGYFSLPVLSEYNAQGVFWLLRYHPQCHVYSGDGQLLELVSLLKGQKEVTDLPILLGEAQLACRLIAVRVPRRVAAERRRKLIARARREGETITQRQLALQSWTILITNLPLDLLSPEEALVFVRLRWQIELLFKLWKSFGQVDESRSTKPYRILCEVYAKLLAMLLQHWVLLTCCWEYPNRSVVKAAQTIRQHALALATGLRRVNRLTAALEVIARCLAAGAKMNSRRKNPNAYQLLLSFQFARLG